MLSALTRSVAVVAILGLPFAVGCDSGTKAPSVPPFIATNATKAVKIVLAVAKRAITAVRVVVELHALVVEIIAIVNGVEEKITVELSEEQKKALEDGGTLIIRDVDGEESPVTYSKK